MGRLHENTVPHVAYFSMEIGTSKDIPTYSGGLGILAGDTLKSFADTGIPVVAMTLLNEQGYFNQTIDSEGNQHEAPVHWEKERFLEKLPHTITITLEGRPVKVGVWRHLLYGNSGADVPIFYLDSNIEGNHGYDRSLTSVLYGGDRKYRLCQEIILGRGGFLMLKELGYHSIKKYHLNEGHAALLTVELLHKYKHIEKVRAHTVFTTHTPVSAGHDRFERGLFTYLCPDVPDRILEKATEDGHINMTLIGLTLAGHVNGVAKRHGEVTRGMFPGYHISTITNGIHPETWASTPFKNLFDTHIPDWKKDPYTLRYALSIPKEQIWAAHEQAKLALIEHINQVTGIGFDHRRFTIGFARRFTAYKRPDMLLLDIPRLMAVAEKVGDIQVVFAGKAHMQDYQGKEIMKRVFQAAQSINARNGRLKVVFLPGYDMYLGKLMTSGCDVWLNNPQRPYEASGTSGMKAALNGVAQISTIDGWWMEGHIEGVTGWSLGPSERDAGFVNDPDAMDEANDCYRKLETSIVPTYYNDRDAWVRIMQHCIAINASFFNTSRMVQQYIASVYSE